MVSHQLTRHAMKYATCDFHKIIPIFHNAIIESESSLLPRRSFDEQMVKIRKEEEKRHAIEF